MTAWHPSVVRASEVLSDDGTVIAVQEQGDPDAPCVVLVHGYPDDHRVWDLVVPHLDGFHVVTYDVRGAGASGAPRGRKHYRLELLEADLAAVVDAVSPGRPVHLVGHDWGSLQSWHAVTGDRLQGRLASYTSFCGTDLDHTGDWFRRRLRRPTRRGLAEALRQFLHSQYISFFLLPVLPEALFRSRGAAVLFRRLGEGAQVQGWPRTSDLVNGLSLYRANMPAHLRAPRPRSTSLPVQVVTATRDAYLTEALQTDIGRWVPQLWTRQVDAGHWAPRSEPLAVARCIRDLVVHVETGTR